MEECWWHNVPPPIGLLFVELHLHCIEDPPRIDNSLFLVDEPGLPPRE